MKRLTLILMAFLLANSLLPADRALAADNQARSLTLEDVLHLARQQNFDVAAAKQHLAAAKVGIEQAWVALLPTAALQGKYTHNYKQVELNLGEFNQSALGLAQTIKAANNAAPAAVQNPVLTPALNEYTQVLNAASAQNITIQKSEQLDSSLNVSVPLVVPAAYASLAAAKKDVLAATANYSVSETDVLYATAQAFYATTGADELVRARGDAVLVSKQTLANSQAALNAGTTKRSDVNQAKVSLLRAEQALREAEDARDQAYRSLATLIQLHEPFQLMVKDPSEVPYSGDLEQDALQRRPEFRAYDAQLASAHAQVNAATLQWTPTLSGFGQAKLSNYLSFSGDYYSWALGIELDWQLYDGGSRDAQRHLVEAQMAETAQHLNALKASVHDDIQNALATVKTKRLAVETSTQALALAKETLGLVRVQYDAGTSKQLDVLEAQDSLVSAEVTLVQARFDVALALLSLARSAGHFPEGVL